MRRSLDVLAGRVRRAPAWMRSCGLEWFYRTLREPRRFPRLAALPRMLLMTLHELATSPDPATGLMDQHVAQAGGAARVQSGRRVTPA